MFAVVGVSGQVGGAVAHTLLAKGKTVRAVVRDEEKGEPWKALGCEIAVADLNSPYALVAAFADTEGVFVMLPPNFDPSPDFKEVRSIVHSIRWALDNANPQRIVALSSIGAQSEKPNLLSQLHLLEHELGTLATPLVFLRPGWFMENYIWQLGNAQETGVISNFLQPGDKPLPMVATADVGQTAAELLLETWPGQRIVELEGAKRLSPREIASTLAEILGHSVQLHDVPRNAWESVFASTGMKNPAPRIQMLDGFNEGWIDFESGEAHTRKGTTSFETVIRSFLAKTERR